MPRVAVENRESAFPVLRPVEGEASPPETLGQPQSLGGSGSVRRSPFANPPEDEPSRIGIVGGVEHQLRRGEPLEALVKLEVSFEGREDHQEGNVDGVDPAVLPLQLTSENSLSGELMELLLGLSSILGFPGRRRRTARGEGEGGEERSSQPARGHPRTIAVPDFRAFAQKETRASLSRNARD